MPVLLLPFVPGRLRTVSLRLSRLGLLLLGSSPTVSWGGCCLLLQLILFPHIFDPLSFVNLLLAGLMAVDYHLRKDPRAEPPLEFIRGSRLGGNQVEGEA